MPRREQFIPPVVIRRPAHHDATVPEPPPKPSEGDVWRAVIEDMEARRLEGIQRYGTPLQPHNGRRALVDLYQELLDACVYLKQALMEKESQP
jgi:hypothetical protein